MIEKIARYLSTGAREKNDVLHLVKHPANSICLRAQFFPDHHQRRRKVGRFLCHPF